MVSEARATHATRTHRTCVCLAHAPVPVRAPTSRAVYRSGPAAPPRARRAPPPSSPVGRARAQEQGPAPGPGQSRESPAHTRARPCPHTRRCVPHTWTSRPAPGWARPTRFPRPPSATPTTTCSTEPEPRACGHVGPRPHTPRAPQGPSTAGGRPPAPGIRGREPTPGTPFPTSHRSAPRSCAITGTSPPWARLPIPTRTPDLSHAPAPMRAAPAPMEPCVHVHDPWVPPSHLPKAAHPPPARTRSAAVSHAVTRPRPGPRTRSPPLRHRRVPPGPGPAWIPFPGPQRPRSGAPFDPWPPSTTCFRGRARQTAFRHRAARAPPRAGAPPGAPAPSAPTATLRAPVVRPPAQPRTGPRSASGWGTCPWVNSRASTAGPPGPRTLRPVNSAVPLPPTGPTAIRMTP